MMKEVGERVVQPITSFSIGSDCCLVYLPEYSRTCIACNRPANPVFVWLTDTKNPEHPLRPVPMQTIGGYTNN